MNCQKFAFSSWNLFSHYTNDLVHDLAYILDDDLEQQPRNFLVITFEKSNNNVCLQNISYTYTTFPPSTTTIIKSTKLNNDMYSFNIFT